MNRRKKTRRWDAVVDDDPLAGLVNLFDLWMVFSIALLLALVAASKLPNLSPADRSSASGSSAEDLASQEKSKLDHFRVSHEKLTGEGQRLGTAYRLKSGEVVYVPD
jgi:hypothetical protein